jgi:cytochrome c biogenesis protein CcmG, thiol:disulfide interchange protein DsbE
MSENVEKKPRELWSGVALALLLVAGFGLVARRVVLIAGGPTPPRQGAAAPSFIAPKLDGGTGGLADHKGQVLLVDFWATWCPPCVASMPTLQRLHSDYKGRGFAVLGVNIEPGEEAKVRAFVRDRGFEFPVVVDDRGEISRAYGVFSYPTTFLVGRDGIVRAVFRGVADERKLREEIEPLLSPAPGKEPS